MLEAADKALLLYLNSLHSPAMDAAMAAISGRLTWLPLYLLLLAALARKHKRRCLVAILAVAVAILAADQISVLIKNAVERPRPTHDPEIGPLVHVVGGYRGGAYGFVSSHAANCFALAALVPQLLRGRWIAAGMAAWATTVSYSRIYLGVHYPGDIVCGAALGAAIGWACGAAARRWLAKKGGNPNAG